MHVNFRKLAVASAVSAALGVAGTAQADNNSLLFPYLTTSATAYSFVTIYHDPFAGAYPAGAPPHAARSHHLYYGFKAINAASTAPCTHRDFPVNVTQGALLQFEAGGKFNLVTEFGDPAGYGTSLSQANNQLPVNSEGFLIVENVDQPINAGERRRGEATIIDTASGLTLSYAAISAANANHGSVANATNPDFSAAAVTATNYVTSWYPRNIVTTSWYALPVSSRLIMTPNNGGGMQTSIRPETNIANIGAYSRAENYTSGSLVNNLTCFGKFGIDQLLGAPFNSGGWMSITATNQIGAAPAFSNAMVAGGDEQFLLYKLQSVPSALGAPVNTISLESVRN